MMRTTFPPLLTTSDRMSRSRRARRPERIQAGAGPHVDNTHSTHGGAPQKPGLIHPAAPRRIAGWAPILLSTGAGLAQAGLAPVSARRIQTGTPRGPQANPGFRTRLASHLPCADRCEGTADDCTVTAMFKGANHVALTSPATTEPRAAAAGCDGATHLSRSIPAAPAFTTQALLDPSRKPPAASRSALGRKGACVVKADFTVWERFVKGTCPDRHQHNSVTRIVGVGVERFGSHTPSVRPQTGDMTSHRKEPRWDAPRS